MVSTGSTSRLERKNVFAVRISYMANGTFYQILAYQDDGYRHYNQRRMTKDEFIHFASGDWPSAYNPNRENLFLKNKVKGGVIVDSVYLTKQLWCPSLDSLWKIRFRFHPFDRQVEEGWSNAEFKPSLTQEQFLFSEFGVRNLDVQYIRDTSFWKLLRSVEDPKWIQSYRFL